MEILAIPSNLKNIIAADNLEISFHSLYKKTINFKVNSLIIAFQEQDLPLTPYSIKTNRLLTNLNSHEVGKLLTQQLNNKSVYKNLKIKKVEQFNREYFVNNLQNFLKSKILKSQIVFAIFRNEINPFSDLILDPPNNLTKFIGLGSGLTPAGDDFIIGYLLGLHLTESISEDIKQKLIKAINIKDATNDISRQFLLAALDGYYNEFIVELVAQLNNGKPTSESLIKISSIGSSSGLDLLAGLYLTIR